MVLLSSETERHIMKRERKRERERERERDNYKNIKNRKRVKQRLM